MTRSVSATAVGFLVLLMVGTRSADPIALAQPPRPGVRVHHDPGHHLGPVGHLFFRERDTELVTVGTDRTVRVWEADPANGPPRARAAFFLPGIPSAAALNSNGERYLALGFLRDPGAKSAVVRVLDLNGATDGAEFPAPSLDFPAAGHDNVPALAFSPDGQNLVMAGPNGAGWVWNEQNWGKVAAAAVLQKFVVKTMEDRRQQILAAAAHAGADTTYLAVAGVGSTVFVSPRDLNGQNYTTWSPYELPGGCQGVYAVAWSRAGDLAAGYFGTGPSGHSHAWVAVFQRNPDGQLAQEPVVRDLGVGITTKLAWLPGREGTLVVARSSDGDTTYQPIFLRLTQARSLDTVPADTEFPGLLAQLARNPRRGGLSGCAVGAAAAPLRMAWAGAAEGTIELVRAAGGTPRPPVVLRPLDPRVGENWYTRATWDAKRGELELRGVGGRVARVRDDDLWRYTGLTDPGDPVWTEPRFLQAAAVLDPVYAVADLRGKDRTLTASAYLLTVKGARPRVYHGVRSLLTFAKANTVIALRGDGELSFWEDQPAGAGGDGFPLRRLATGYLHDGRLRFRTDRGSGNWPAADVVEVADGSAAVHHRVYAQEGPGLRRNPRVAAGLNPDLVLPPGKHTFRIDVPAAGTVTVRVADRSEPHAVRAGENDITVGLKVGDRTVEADFVPDGGAASRGIRRGIQVGDPGRVFLIDITPQLEGNHTDQPDPMNPKLGKRATARLLTDVLEKLGRAPVLRRSTETFAGADRVITELSAPVPGGIQRQDCVFMLVKGHGDVFHNPAGNGLVMDKYNPHLPHAVFRSDDFTEKAARDGDETGITRTRLKHLVGRLAGLSDKVVVVLDCCNAEHFLDAVSHPDVSYYPCSLKGLSVDASIFPTGLRNVLPRLGGLRAEPSGLVCQDDLLRAIKAECYACACDKAKDRPDDRDSWGFEWTPRRFVIGW